MFEFDILEVKDYRIEKTGTKNYLNSDNTESLTDWLKEDYKYRGDITTISLSSPLNVKGVSKRKITSDTLGWFSCGTNVVLRNTLDVGLFTTPYSHSGTSGYLITDSNFNKVNTAFTVRKLINPNWTNEVDYYFKPNEIHFEYEQFIFDSLVYSIMNTASNQSSLRGVVCEDETYNIKNEFFWMSKDRMKELADENGYDNLYNDARTSSDRHVYNLLFGEERIYDQLSDDAKVVLDKATELVEQSFQMRQVMADDHNHLDSWDAGYAQLKLVWKEYFEEDFKEFRQLYKNLEDRMRPLVYELGFLMK